MSVESAVNKEFPVTSDTFFRNAINSKDFPEFGAGCATIISSRRWRNAYRFNHWWKCLESLALRSHVRGTILLLVQTFHLRVFIGHQQFRRWRYSWSASPE